MGVSVWMAVILCLISYIGAYNASKPAHSLHGHFVGVCGLNMSNKMLTMGFFSCYLNFIACNLENISTPKTTNTETSTKEKTKFDGTIWVETQKQNKKNTCHFHHLMKLQFILKRNIYTIQWTIFGVLKGFSKIDY